jgi:hypothetical protein
MLPLKYTLKPNDLINILSVTIGPNFDLEDLITGALCCIVRRDLYTLPTRNTIG